MTAFEALPSLKHQALHEAARQACARIAPTWPLDRMIAVSPLWERRDQAWQTVAAQLWQRAGSRLTLDTADYRQAWQDGRIAERHLQQALAEQGASCTPVRLLEVLNAPTEVGQGLPLLEDLAEPGVPLPGWPALITQQIGQSCAAWFDHEQADWRPADSAGLYQAWRASLLADRGLSVLSACRDLHPRIAELPMQPEAALEAAVEQLGLPAEDWALWFDCLLLRNLGWASWCAYRRWQARLQGEDDQTLLELLAIRAAWEWLVDDRRRDAGSRWHSWRAAWQERSQQAPSANWRALQLWQRADELAWQEQLQRALCQSTPAAAPTAPLAKLFFCIDVRSEPLRRALEQTCPELETGGFAGFFGLPIAYTPLGTLATRPQLPGLLAPQLQVSDGSGDAERDRQLAELRQERLARQGRWRLFERLPASTFTLVESVGLGYAGALLGRTYGLAGGAPSPELSAWRRHERQQLQPRLPALSRLQQVDLAERILKAMGLSGQLPPLLVLVGHGSQSANNPQAAGLDCGACCGQSGEINARLLAGLLNDPEVRIGLRVRGLDLPPHCQVLAGLHNTTTDEVQVFGHAALPAALQPSWQRLRAALDGASAEVRRQRASTLGLAPLQEQPAKLLGRLRRRARDWAQTRPEWGLAGNAAFIAAPRARTRAVDLQGRAFLHDYDWRQDAGGKVLELIMTAPMVVAHWINLQYFTSTTDNLRFGSGNKLLHNVVGGHIGVFEGNGGDLRIGLARQSLHDGQQWMHRPLRLHVVIEAPRAMIDQVIANHAVVRDLVRNGWLHLLRLDGQPACLELRTAGGWRPLPEV
ncbi:YbcC family protein [Pseudomonas benzopyrenica]|uniref:YbcC family protein n=1 Tax=Pseudomonas benzopyrenica TaxID=2993566 RepID=UPI003F16DA65